jgi:DNA repair protein RadC
MNKVSELKITYTNKVPVKERIKVSLSSQAEPIFREKWEGMETYETFKLLLLNRSNHVLGVMELSKGGVAGTVVDAKLVFSTALKAMASGIILAHNHPSGNLKPSKADIDLTRKLKRGGKLLDINILDHFILTSEGYFSLADEGLI